MGLKRANPTLVRLGSTMRGREILGKHPIRERGLGNTTGDLGTVVNSLNNMESMETASYFSRNQIPYSTRIETANRLIERAMKYYVILLVLQRFRYYSQWLIPRPY